MASATWTMLCLLLAVNSAEVQVVSINGHKVRIPFGLPPEQRSYYRQLNLFVNNGQDQQWTQAAVASPDDSEFIYIAPSDGVYLFKVGGVDQQGRELPSNLYASPVRYKVIVDTAKPVVHITSERYGDKVIVRWNITEEHPHLPSLKLDYRLAANPDSPWRPAPVSLGGLTGQTSFQVDTPAELVVRLTLYDTAGNEGQDEAKVIPGTADSTTLPTSSPAIPPPAHPPITQDVASGSAANTGEHDWSPKSFDVPTQPVSMTQNPRPAPAPPANLEPLGRTPIGNNPWNSPPPVAPPSNEPYAQAVASSVDNNRWPGQSSGVSAPGSPASFTLPPVRVTNQRQIFLEYEVGKYGPSGVGNVDLYMTRDDGRSWQRIGGEQNPELPPAGIQGPGASVTRTLRVDLAGGEGVYGFYLIVHSRAGLGKPPPRNGELPQLRVELDLTQPVIQLYRPMPDPQRRDTLVLRWQATDRNHNLTATPITLAWAEQKGGPWHIIGASDLPNTGQYTWQPQGVPHHVFLRVLARDTAGNIAEAATDEPICIDLSEPEVISLRLANSPNNSK